MKHYRKGYSELYGPEGWLMTEMDEEYYALRAIFKNSEQEYTSNFSETNEFGLPEGSLKEILDELEIISKNDFEEMWESIIGKHRNEWELTKSSLDIGMEINAIIKYFYPQGVILDIGELFLGIANYEKCKAILGAEKMYPQTEIQLKIDFFDDENMWVGLST